MCVCVGAWWWCVRVCVMCCYVRCSEVPGAMGASIPLMKGPVWRRQETPEKWRRECLKSADPCHTDMRERSRRAGEVGMQKGHSSGPQGPKG